MADAPNLEESSVLMNSERKKEKFTLFSDHNGSLLRQQPGALMNSAYKRLKQ